MATEIAEAYIALHTKMPGVQRDITSALDGVDTKGAGEKVGKKAKGGLLKGFALGGAVGGVVAVAFDALAGSVGGLVAEAADASDATDKFKKTLDFSGIGTDEIDRLTASAQAYADKTVYGLGDIQNITAQLAANGVKDFDQLAEAAGNLNAVAGGNAETFKSVGMVLTQTAGQGKLTTENWNQLADAIPGASGQLQKALAEAGAYTGNFRDAMAEGQITADEFNAALLELGSEPVAVEAATSTETLEGALGNLRATIVGGLSKAITAMKPVLTGLITGFSNVLSTVIQFIATLGQGMDLGAFAELLQYLTPLGLVFQVLQPILPVLADAFGQIAMTLGTALMSVLPALLPVFQQVAALLSSLAAQVIPMLLPIVVMLAEVFGEVMEAVAPIIAALVDALVPILEALIPVVVSVLGAFLPVIKALVTALAPILTVIADIVGAVLVPVLDVLIGVIEFLAEVIKWLVKNVVVPFFIGVLIPAIKDVGKIFEDVFGGLGDFFSGIWDAIGAGFRGFINFIIDSINNFIAGLNVMGDLIAGATAGAIDFNIGSIPRLAAGGVVQATPGGILANIGEGRYDEVVLPLSPEVLGQLGGSGGLADGTRLILVVDGHEFSAYVRGQSAVVTGDALAPFSGGGRR